MTLDSLGAWKWTRVLGTCQVPPGHGDPLCPVAACVGSLVLKAVRRGLQRRQRFLPYSSPIPGPPSEAPPSGFEASPLRSLSGWQRLSGPRNGRTGVPTGAGAITDDPLDPQSAGFQLGGWFCPHYAQDGERVWSA